MKAVKTATHPKTEPEIPELVLFCEPPKVLSLIRSGNANALSTKSLNVLYVVADSIEKTIRTLKEKCKPVIISRRDEGEPTGDEKQHRAFHYRTPAGDMHLIVQQRIVQQPDLEKLEALLRSKDLWQQALTTSLDMEKVDGLCKAGLITEEELSTVADPPRTTYALIARTS